MWLTFSILLISFTVAALAVGWLTRASASAFALDKPNARSLHKTPVPRTGGIGLLLGVAAGWAVAGPNLPVLVWFAIALLVGVSLADDMRDRGLSAALRLIAQLVAASLAFVAIQPAYVLSTELIVTVLTMCWMCNLYNFMDGSDGLAGGMTLCGFACYAIAAWLGGNAHFALLNLAIAAAAAGFLLYNFHPARIFLGDVGSVPLGFFAALFGWIGWFEHIWTWWFPILVFSPFITDASMTLLRRAYARNAIWQAHRDHYYQRLVQLGWGHRNTALVEYLLMMTCGTAALTGLRWTPSGQLALLVVAAIVYAALIASVEIAWRKRQQAGKS